MVAKGPEVEAAVVIFATKTLLTQRAPRKAAEFAEKPRTLGLASFADSVASFAIKAFGLDAQLRTTSRADSEDMSFRSIDARRGAR
jgi:hypothetical protein